LETADQDETQVLLLITYIRSVTVSLILSEDRLLALEPYRVYTVAMAWPFRTLWTAFSTS